MGNSNSMSQAVSLFEQGKFEQAHGLFEELFRSQRKTTGASPSSLSLLLHLALTCEETGRFERANELWQLRQKGEFSLGMTKREQTAVSRFGAARCSLFLGRNLGQTVMSLDACQLDTAILGDDVNVCLALGLFFTGEHHKAVTVAKRSVQESMTASPSQQVLSLLLLHLMSGDSDALRKIFPLLALSATANEKVLRLCEKRLTFMVFELCNLHQHEAVLVAKFQVQMLERIELLKTSSIYCYALFGLAWAQGCQPDAIETALDLKQLLESSSQTREPLYGRCVLLLGSIHLDLKQPREALMFLEQALSFYNDNPEGRARVLVPYRAALDLIGQKDELAGQLASDSAVFSTLSRATQQRLLASLGKPQDVLSAPAALKDEDEAADLRTDERDRDFDSYRMIVLATREMRAEQQQQQQARVPALDRSKLPRRASIVDVFASTSPRPEGSPRPVSAVSPKPSPRTSTSPRPEPSPRPVSVSPRPPVSPPARKAPSSPAPAAPVPPLPERDDSATMKIALQQMRKEIPRFSEK